MFSKLRKHLNPASLLAVMALFMALGGVSYAAKKIGTDGLRNGAVSAPKLKKEAVTTPKIRANAVTGAKVAESSLSEVPKAAQAERASKADTAGKADSANHAKTADSANHANSANSAATATNAQQLGGVPAAQFGAGILGAAITAPPAAALAPSFAEGAPIGSGDEFQLPIPVPVKVSNLFVKAVGDLSRPFVVSLRNPGQQALTCGGVGACSNPSSVEFKPGDVLELAVTVPPGPAIFGGATYQVGYKVSP